MLTTRILTAAVLIPLTLGALFWLSPRGWAVFTLAIVGIAAMEWAELADYRSAMWLLFVAGTLLIGLSLLFVPVSGFEPDRGEGHGRLGRRQQSRRHRDHAGGRSTGGTGRSTNMSISTTVTNPAAVANSATTTIERLSIRLPRANKVDFSREGDEPSAEGAD